MSATLQAPTAERRQVLRTRIRLLAGATITYNLIEAVVSLWAGGVADSSALVGFGLDSVIEVTSALALSWQFSAKDPERREHLTLRIIAISFFALAAFVAVEAVRSLAGAGEAQHSLPGIIIAALSLAIMPVLSWAQRRAGRELGSRTAVADSKQTLLCTYLSAVLLIGLVLNSTLGWWWADAGAALVIAGIAVREGINAWRGDACCALPSQAEDDGCSEAPAAKADDGDGCCAAPVPLGAGEAQPASQAPGDGETQPAGQARKEGMAQPADNPGEPGCCPDCAGSSAAGTAKPQPVSLPAIGKIPHR